MTTTEAVNDAGNGWQAAGEGVLWRRFWQTAAGFWTGRSAWTAWPLSLLLVGIVCAQLAVQYLLNFWNRDFFNALEQRDALALQHQAWAFLPLAGTSIVLACISVWGRMTTQRKWRESLTSQLIKVWLENGHFRRLAGVAGEHKNPEYRIAEDARVATDAPIDFAVGVLAALLTAGTFVEILASVGGNYPLVAFGHSVMVPNYLVVAVFLYSGLVTGAMLVVGHPLIAVMQNKNQAEAELIAAANVLRHVGEAHPLEANSVNERLRLWDALRNALERWRQFLWRLVRTTLVSHTNFLLAPIIGLLLCAPKYLSGDMTLGEMTQGAAAFTVVQSAFNYLVDNYQRIADWRSSVNRVAALLLALDTINGTPTPSPETASSPETAPPISPP